MRFNLFLFFAFILSGCGNKTTSSEDGNSLSPIVLETVGSHGEVFYELTGLSKGLILCFHGTGGGASGWSNDEKYNFVNSLHNSGYAIVCPTSVDRISKQWSATNNASNADILNVEALLTTLGVPASTKLFLVGHSNGGGFTARLAAWGARRNFIEAIQISNSQGIQAIYADNSYIYPSLFNYADCDPIVNAANVRTSMSTLSGRSVTYLDNDLDATYTSGTYGDCHEFVDTFTTTKQFFSTY